MSVFLLPKFMVLGNYLNHLALLCFPSITGVYNNSSFCLIFFFSDEIEIVYKTLRTQPEFKVGVSV